MTSNDSDYYVVLPLPLLNAPGSTLKVYAILRSYLNPAEPEKNEVWPSRKALAKRAELSLDTIDRSIRWLEENGWIRVYGQVTEDGDRTSNRYVIYGSQRQPVTQFSLIEGGGRSSAATLPDSAATVAANLVEEVEPVELPNKKGGRATQIPEDFQPSPAVIAWTKKNAPDIDAREQWAIFCDHHAAKGSVMKDWDRAWYTWARKAQSYAKERAARKTPTQRQREAQPSGVLIPADNYRERPIKRAFDFD